MSNDKAEIPTNKAKHENNKEILLTLIVLC
jgi:hypothetical protein